MTAEKTKEDYKTEFLHHIYSQILNPTKEEREFVNSVIQKFSEIMEEYSLSQHPQPLSREELIDKANNFFKYLEEIPVGAKEFISLKLIQAIKQRAIDFAESLFLPRQEVKQEWISVKDKLPEESCSVIVFTDKKGLGEAWFSKSLGWHNLRDGAIVTHWMPLPEPPKDSNQ